MTSRRTQGQLAGALVLLAVLLAVVLGRRRRAGTPAAVPAKDAVLGAARHARDTSVSTLGKAGGVAQGLLGEASELLGAADAGETLEKLQQALDDARGALAARAR
jgi:hypothetical protein